MKVLHIFDRYLNTTMNWAYNMIVHMNKCESFIAAPILIKNEFAKGDFQLLITPIQKIMGMAKNEWRVSLLQRFYAKLGITHFQRSIKQQIKNNNIQIVHLHFASVACLHMDWLHKMKMPFVVSFYGYDYEKLPFTDPKYILLYQRLFELSDQIICEGPHGKKTLIDQYNCPESKIHIVPIGVDYWNIPFHKRTKNPNELKILQAATFTQKKGHYYTIQAFQQALVLCPNMHLYLTGEEWGQDILLSLKQYVIEHNMGNKVSFLDFTPYAKLHQSLSEYHVLIQPSIYADNRDCEGGAPIIILDAMATAMPVIGSDHCDIPNLIIDHKTGWICPSKDVKSLAEIIANIYRMNQQEYDLFSQSARRSVEDKFDIRKTSSKLTNIYMDIINKE